MQEKLHVLASDSLETRLERLYAGDLYKSLRINPKTGEIGLDEGRGLKFPTLPFIGSRYGDGPRILFVGLDIGCDEKPGIIQDFIQRRSAIESQSLERHNPHIAGTYFIAMYLLRDQLASMRASWQGLEEGRTCKNLLKAQAGLPVDNPLSYVALTNYYKFVSIGRDGRAGARNRRYLSAQTKAIEQRFFLHEVRAFMPDMIVFQSAVFQQTQYQPILQELREHAAVFVAPHPSARHKGARIPSAMAFCLEQGRCADFMHEQE